LRAQTVSLDAAAGKLLNSPIFEPSGKKLLAKGHQISAEDVRLLVSSGHSQVSVTILEEGEVPEEDAAVQVASESACGAMEIRVAAGGRANLFAVEDCCLLVDEEALRRVNNSGSITVATLPNLSYALAGQRVGTVKTAPFAVPSSELAESIEYLRTRGPILQARPIRAPAVAVLYSDPNRADRARTLFESIMHTRLERIGVSPAFALSSLETEEAVARSLEHLLRARPSLVLVASTTAPAGPLDVVGRALSRAGCEIESFLAPVEPGNLLLLSYLRDIPVVAAPGCFRSPRPNVVDLILPALLARYRLTAREISSLGHGGLLP